jgi:cation:H+ antiporter
MMIGFWLVVLIVSLFVLVKSADFFIDASEKVGLILGISPFFIGVTIVALGTSLPELITSIIAMLNDSSEMVIGNVVGSNIANILLVVGITAIAVRKLNIDRDILHLDLPLLAASTIILVIMVSWDGVVNIFEGLIALVVYVVYMIYLYKSRHDTVAEELNKKFKETKEKLVERKMEWKLIGIIILSCIFLFLGAKYTVTSALALSAILGITTAAISLSAIAIGTSLPELAVTIRAAGNGNGDLAIGNIFGSNLFNGSLVVGIATFFGPLQVGPEVTLIALPFLVMATFLYIFSGMSHKIYNYEGAMFVLIYIMFLAKLFKVF